MLASFGWLIIEQYCSFDDVLRKTRVIGEPYHVRLTDETWVVWCVIYFGKRKYLASYTLYDPPTKQVWYGGSFLVLGIRYIFVVSYGGGEAELESLQHLNYWFVSVCINTTIDNSNSMIISLWERLRYFSNCQ